MARRKINGPLLVLAKLLEVNEATIFKLQELTGIKNWYTLNRHLEILKNIGFIKERYVEGPPMRRFISLTEKGREAAACAKRILELAGVL